MNDLTANNKDELRTSLINQITTSIDITFNEYLRHQRDIQIINRPSS